MTENEVILTELVVAEVKVLHASQLDQQLRNHRNSQIRKGSVWQVTLKNTTAKAITVERYWLQDILIAKGYSGTSDKGAPEIAKTSLHKGHLFKPHANTLVC